MTGATSLTLRRGAGCATADQREPAACDGIGPAGVERYDDEIIAVIDDVPPA